MIEFMVDENVIPEDNLKIFHTVDNIDEALDYIEGYDVECIERYEKHV
jgi:predicted Rossmann-fold nucleotide-binding protein